MREAHDVPTARIVVLAGPSGSGKSRLAERIGPPILRLDDFYRDGTEPGLPRAHGIVDWDDPASWNRDAALEAIRALCRDGCVAVPQYDIATSSVRSHYVVEAGREPLVLAEGIFAAEVIPALTEQGLLAAAFCLTHRPLITFARRLARDLRESRKPPLTLLRRGWALMRAEPAIVARQVALGASACPPAVAEERIRALRVASTRG